MTTLLLLHVVIRLVGIFAGFVVAYGFLTARRLNAWNAIFLATTIATSFFPRGVRLKLIEEQWYYNGVLVFSNGNLGVVARTQRGSSS